MMSGNISSYESEACWHDEVFSELQDLSKKEAENFFRLFDIVLLMLIDN